MPRDADALRIFVPVAIRAIFMRLAPRLEAAAGRALAPIFDLNPAIPKCIQARNSPVSGPNGTAENKATDVLRPVYCPAETHPSRSSRPTRHPAPATPAPARQVP